LEQRVHYFTFMRMEDEVFIEFALG
jgi:hypothetical protein